MTDDHPRCHPGQLHPRSLAYERHRPAAPGVDFEDVDAGSAVVALLHRILHVHEPDDAEFQREGGGLILYATNRFIAQRDWRDNAG